MITWSNAIPVLLFLLVIFNLMSVDGTLSKSDKKSPKKKKVETVPVLPTKGTAAKVGFLVFFGLGVF